MSVSQERSPSTGEVRGIEERSPSPRPSPPGLIITHIFVLRLCHCTISTCWSWPRVVGVLATVFWCRVGRRSCAPKTLPTALSSGPLDARLEPLWELWFADAHNSRAPATAQLATNG